MAKSRARTATKTAIRDAVDSTCVSKVEHDGGSKLGVTFKKSGAQYEYNGPSKTTASRMVAANSVGKFFNANIRDKYPFKKLKGGAKGKKKR